MTPAHTDLVDFRTDVKIDFKNNKPRLNEILMTLGFQEHYKDMMKDDQEAAVELLFKFKTNMTGALQGEIVAAGGDAALIAAITGYADTLRDANITQEVAKAFRPEISAAGVVAFNEIYDTTIGVCKMATRIFKDQPLVKAKFSFAKRAKAMDSQHSPANPAGGGN